MIRCKSSTKNLGITSKNPGGYLAPINSQINAIGKGVENQAIKEINEHLGRLGTSNGGDASLPKPTEELNVNKGTNKERREKLSLARHE